jgi:hypothetical protein
LTILCIPLTVVFRASARDEEGDPMAESGTIIAGGNCGENDCPTITYADEGMVDVQGYDVSSPCAETVARVPARLIIEAARALESLPINR